MAVSSRVPTCDAFQMSREGFHQFFLPSTSPKSRGEIDIHIEGLSKTQLVCEDFGSRPTPGSLTILPYCVHQCFSNFIVPACYLGILLKVQSLIQ